MLKTLVLIAIASLVLFLGYTQWAYMNSLTAKERIIATSRFPIVGESAPGFSLPTLSQGQLSLSDYAGRPLVINFWTTWCGLCKQELPIFQAFQEQDSGRIAFLSICAGSSADEARALIAAGGYAFPVLYDADKTVARAYQPQGPTVRREITAFPFTVFVDADRTVVYARAGVFSSLGDLVDRLRTVEFPVN